MTASQAPTAYETREYVDVCTGAGSRLVATPGAGAMTDRLAAGEVEIMAGAGEGAEAMVAAPEVLAGARALMAASGMLGRAAGQTAGPWLAGLGCTVYLPCRCLAGGQRLQGSFEQTTSPDRSMHTAQSTPKTHRSATKAARQE